MTGERPAYFVALVQDRGQWGLLLEKSEGSDSLRERGYFWISGGEGLLPNDTLRGHCSYGCHVLHPKRRGQQLIARELKAYAAAAHRTGAMRARRAINGDYFDHEDYRDMVNHFFEQDTSRFSAFFGTAREFKTSVLRQVPGRLEVEGRAKLFTVCPPEDLWPTRDTGYLKPIHKTLKPALLENEDPDWFRKGGPVAADLDAGCVCDRGSTVTTLRQHVFANSVSLLQGDPATGKTTLVRQLAHELSRDKGKPVYYLSCHAVDDTFDPDRLIERLKGIRSVVKSDHVLNLFGDLEGTLPGDKDRMIAILRSFLEMEPELQTLYQVGRRLGVFSSLQDLDDPRKRALVEEECRSLNVTAENVDEVVTEKTRRFV